MNSGVVTDLVGLSDREASGPNGLSRANADMDVRTSQTRSISVLDTATLMITRVGAMRPRRVFRAVIAMGPWKERGGVHREGMQRDPQGGESRWK